MYTGIYTNQELQLFKDCLHELYGQDCLIEVFSDYEEIYSSKRELDVLVLETDGLTEEIFQQISASLSESTVIVVTGAQAHRFPLCLKIAYTKQDFEKLFAGRKKSLIHFKMLNEKHLIPLKDIVYAAVNKELLYIHLRSQRILRDNEKPAALLVRLSDSRFFMSDKNTIVNADYILKEENGFFILKNAIKIPIQKYDRNKIINKFYEYKMQKFKAKRLS